MNNKQDPASPNPIAQAAMARHLETIRRLKIDHDYAYRADELVTRVTGRSLSIQPFMTYLTAKYSDIYGI